MQNNHAFRSPSIAWAGLLSRSVLLVLLLLTVSCAAPRAQSRPEEVARMVAANPAPRTAKFEPIAPEERLEILGENGHWPYVIGIGDGLRITGDTDFLKNFGESRGGDLYFASYVKPDGNVYLPELGAVEAAGKTVIELQKAIRTRLEKYKKNPFASVDVIEFRSQKFYVLGAVQRPGSYPVDGTTSLLGSLGLAGGASDTADLELAYVVRDSKILPVSVADMVMRGDMSRNVTMRKGDLLFVPPREEARVYVVGEVSRPGPVPMPAKPLTLAAAVASVGGVDMKTADINDIVIYRGGWESPTSFKLSTKDVYEFGESIQLHSGDRIIVAPSSQATNARAAALVLPYVNTALSAIITAVAVSNVSK